MLHNTLIEDWAHEGIAASGLLDDTPAAREGGVTSPSWLVLSNVQVRWCATGLELGYGWFHVTLQATGVLLEHNLVALRFGDDYLLAAPQSEVLVQAVDSLVMRHSQVMDVLVASAALGPLGHTARSWVRHKGQCWRPAGNRSGVEHLLLGVGQLVQPGAPHEAMPSAAAMAAVLLLGADSSAGVPSDSNNVPPTAKQVRELDRLPFVEQYVWREVTAAVAAVTLGREHGCSEPACVEALLGAGSVHVNASSIRAATLWCPGGGCGCSWTGTIQGPGSEDMAVHGKTVQCSDAVEHFESEHHRREVTTWVRPTTHTSPTRCRLIPTPHPPPDAGSLAWHSCGSSSRGSLPGCGSNKGVADTGAGVSLCSCPLSKAWLPLPALHARGGVATGATKAGAARPTTPHHAEGPGAAQGMASLRCMPQWAP